MSYKINDTVVVDDSRNVCACCVTSCCFTASDQMIIPSGNTAGRPTGATGSLYFDTDEAALVAYDGTEWAKQGGSGVTQKEITLMGNMVGPFACQANKSTGPTTGMFNPCKCIAYTLELCGSLTLSKSFRWCETGCCLCYLSPVPAVTPSPTCPFPIACQIGTINNDSIACCASFLKHGTMVQISNCVMREVSDGARFTLGGQAFYTCDICGHSCGWYASGLHPVSGTFVANMSNPDFVTYFSAGFIFSVCEAPELCNGYCCCKGIFTTCICAGLCCGNCVGPSTPHKVLYEKVNDLCCTVFTVCCQSKAFCCPNVMSVANGFLASFNEEGPSNCCIRNHYVFICADTGETKRLFTSSHCHGYLWDECQLRGHAQIGMNAVLYNPRCCRCDAFEGCFRGSYITVSLKGTPECPCFDPADYTIKCCCCFTGSTSLPRILTKGQISCCNGMGTSGKHPHHAFGKYHFNQKPIATEGSLAEPTDLSYGWAGAGEPQLITEAPSAGVNKATAGSYRTAVVVDGETTPTFFTSYVPDDVDTWSCAYVCNAHPSTPCPQNLRFLKWLPGSGPMGGPDNRWHAGLFQSINCTCTCCKCLTYVALFCG